jgi:hypothetical protein
MEKFIIKGVQTIHHLTPWTVDRLHAFKYKFLVTLTTQ